MSEPQDNSTQVRTERLLIREIVRRVCTRESQATRSGLATYISLFERDYEKWTEQERVLLLALHRYREDDRQKQVAHTEDRDTTLVSPGFIHLDMTESVLTPEGDEILTKIVREIAKKKDENSWETGMEGAAARLVEMSAPDSEYVVSPKLNSDVICVWQRAMEAIKFVSPSLIEPAIGFVAKSQKINDPDTKRRPSSSSKPIRKKVGRPKVTKLSAEEKRVSTAWASGKYLTCRDCDMALGKDEGTTKTIVDRLRKRGKSSSANPIG